MIPDTILSTLPRSPRSLARRMGRSLGREPNRAMAWQIRDHSLVSPAGKKFKLVRHGIDRYTVRQLTRHAAIVYGEFPFMKEITLNTSEVDDALLQVSTSGDLFTIYASVYRRGSHTVVLLDYLT